MGRKDRQSGERKANLTITIQVQSKDDLDRVLEALADDRLAEFGIEGVEWVDGSGRKQWTAIERARKNAAKEGGRLPE